MKQSSAVAKMQVDDMVMGWDMIANAKKDKRVQVKMPQVVFDVLGKLVDKGDRSDFITKAVLERLKMFQKFPNAPIRDIVDQEQGGLDTMWDYIKEREND